MKLTDTHLGMISTCSGVTVDFKNPTVDMINIHDISNGLSKICRFGGQINEFYSVAQHSILVAKLAPKELRREALFHDAPEAYLGDVVKPLKIIIGKPYEEIETRFTEIIFQKFGLDVDKLPLIKQYDKEALFIEDEYLRKHGPNEKFIKLFSGQAWAASVANWHFQFTYQRYFL